MHSRMAINMCIFLERCREPRIFLVLFFCPFLGLDIFLNEHVRSLQRCKLALYIVNLGGLDFDATRCLLHFQLLSG